MRTIPARLAVKLTLAMGLCSLVCLAVFLAFRQIDDVRGVAGGVGMLLAPSGSAVGIWSAIRLRSVACAAAAIPALTASAGWAWIVRAALQS